MGCGCIKGESCHICKPEEWEMDEQDKGLWKGEKEMTMDCICLKGESCYKCKPEEWKRGIMDNEYVWFKKEDWKDINMVIEDEQNEGGMTKRKDVREVEMEKETSYYIAQDLIQKRQLKGGRMGINDDLCNTNLISKNYSPMFIRKFNASPLYNWPLYISMICDEDVSDIDMVVNGALKAYDEAGLIKNDLQCMRNLTGILSETISKYYNNKKENNVEGIAITLYIDKAYVQNLTGDFMSHFSVRMEYTSALLMMTQI